MTHTRLTASAALLGLGVLWGTNFVFMQLAEPYLSISQITLLRLLFGLLPVVAFAAATRALSWSHLRYLPHFLIQAILAAGLYYYAYAAGTFRLDSGVAGVLSGSIPLFATLGAVAFFRTEAPTLRKLIGIVLGAVGVVVLAQPWRAESTDLIGVVWMLVGSASLGLSFGYARRFISPLHIPAAASASYQMVLATLAFAVATDYSGITSQSTDTGAWWGVIIGLGIFGTGIAFILYYVAVNGLGAVTASTATYIAPVVALIIGIVLLGEELHLVTVIAVVLILAAAMTIQPPSLASHPRKQHRTAEAEPPPHGQTS